MPIAAAGLLSVAAPSAARAEEAIPVPVVRMMLGPSFHVGQQPILNFAADVTAGAVVLLGSRAQFMIDGELGFTHDGELQAFNLMFGIGVGKEFMAYATYQPRMILGTIDEVFAGGMRNAIAGHFLFDMFSAEVGHQFIASQGKLTQSVNLMFGVNPAALVFVIVAFVGGGR